MLLILKRVSILLLTIWLGLLLSSCGSQEPIKIGFAGELTGRQLAVGIRNGAQLAVETINANGGINGRPLELLIEDNQGDPEVARQVSRKLTKAGVVAIIGHITSGQTAAVLEQMNEAKVVLLSPTASSTQFSNQQDYFFRIHATADLEGAALAKYAYQTLNLRQVSGIYETENKAFTEGLWRAFQTKFESLGGEIVQEFSFSANQDGLAPLAEQVLSTNSPALVFVSTASDTALFAQYANLAEGKKPILLAGSGSQANVLLTKGGQAVEGLVFTSVYNSNNSNPPFQAFAQTFRKRFGEDPDFAVYGYEAVQVLAEALRETGGEAAGLPEALTRIKQLPVIQGNLSMNEYGDVERDVYITVVEDGQFKIVQTVSSD